MPQPSLGGFKDWRDVTAHALLRSLPRLSTPEQPLLVSRPPAYRDLLIDARDIRRALYRGDAFAHGSGEHRHDTRVAEELIAMEDVD